MALAARMDRMVSFRLSEDEYDEFLDVCRTSHARSVSEVARMALQYWLEHAPADGNGNGDLQSKVQDLEAKLAELTAEVKTLRRKK